MVRAVEAVLLAAAARNEMVRLLRSTAVGPSVGSLER
jgi:hypothetical protein